jgi:hypothetical protein
MNKDTEELKIIEKRIIAVLYVLRFLCMALILYTNVILLEMDIDEALEISSLGLIGVLFLTLVLKFVKCAFEKEGENKNC